MWFCLLLFISIPTFEYCMQISHRIGIQNSSLTHSHSHFEFGSRSHSPENLGIKRYSTEEMNKISQLREMTSDLPTDEYMQRDHFVIRWLRARSFDLDAANQMAREAWQWRKENRMDSILTERNILDVANRTYRFQGHDKEGRPVVLITATYLDLRKLLLEGKRANILRYFDQMLERAYYLVRNTNAGLRNGEEITDVIVILDSEGYSIKQHACLQCMSVYWDFMQHLENYYPELMKYLIVINIKKVVVPTMKALRSLSHPCTQETLQIFGPHKPEWSKFILSIISADQLPYRFGGTQPDSAQYIQF